MATQATDSLIPGRCMGSDIRSRTWPARSRSTPTHLGFTLEHQQLPAFASVSLVATQLLLSGPGASGSRPTPDGQGQHPGGWNRVVLRVRDLSRLIGRSHQCGPPLSERHGVGSGRQADPGRGSRRQSDRAVRTGTMRSQSWSFTAVA